MRVAVVGDVGGQLAALESELTRLGADPDTGRLPADLVVVQVGDLIHRGPDSDQVVALVDRHLSTQPDQWVQLVGNHESLYVAEPAFTWRERIGKRAAATLTRWWRSGSMVVAAAIRTEDEELLVTHAGLTSLFWREGLGSPGTAAAAARRLNALADQGEGRRDLPFRAGTMLYGSPDWTVGPVWASARDELIPSWSSEPMPFSQVHGHSMITRWDTAELLGHPVGDPSAGPGGTPATTVDLEAKHETTWLKGGRIVGIDPGHGVHPRTRWRAWVIDGVVTR